MALPTVAQLKSYCRIQTTAEDTMLTARLAQAQAMVEGILGRPITAASRTDVIRIACATTRFTLPVWPVDPDTLALTDPDGDTVDDATYTVAVNGLVEVVDLDADVFAAGRYRATYDAGWSAHPDYATRYEPILSSAMLDLAADLYQRRNPNATQESSGGGISVSYSANGIPERVMQTLKAMLPMDVR